jgi:hypothetical protein
VPSSRYIVQQTVTVHSADVDRIARAGQKTVELVQAGIVVGGGFGQAIRYKFDGLNAPKPDMITERRGMRDRRLIASQQTREAKWDQSVQRTRVSLLSLVLTEPSIAANDDAGGVEQIRRRTLAL